MKIKDVLEELDDKRAVAIYQYMVEYARQNAAVAPTVREIALHFKRTPNLIFRKMQKLMKAGLIYHPRGHYSAFALTGASLDIGDNTEVINNEQN